MSKRQTPARTAKLAEPEKLEDKVVENVVPEPVAQPAAEPETPAPETAVPAAAVEPAVVQDAQTGAETEGTTAPGEQEPAARKGDGLVEVRNDLGTYLQQPSTGIRIHAHSTARVADDSWLGMQVRARLLTRV